jgi:hypothetical protein
MREYFGVQLVRILAVAEARLPAVWRAQSWAWLGCYHEALSVFLESDLPSRAFAIRSMAACGRRAEAESLARSVASPRGRRSVATAVSAFDPALAAALLKDAPPSPLQAAVLSAIGRKSKAGETLGRIPRRFDKDPNVALLRANCGTMDPLEALNHSLAYFGLSTVASDGNAFPGSLRPHQDVTCTQGPLVSIIVPAHNTESLVESAVGSLLNQTWSNLEILAVDDASTDATREKLHRLAASDSRVRVLSQARNAGPYAARMTALAVAQGECVTCHDSDDWAHPQRIERQVAPLLRNSRLMATVSDWVRMADDGAFYVRKSWPLIHHNPASVMFRREPVLSRMGGFDLVRAGADSEFYERLKVVFGARAVRRTKGILAVGSHRAGSLMNDPEIGVTNHVLSPSRLAYWEAWRRWHVETLRSGSKPFMPAHGPRPFPAPAELVMA